MQGRAVACGSGHQLKPRCSSELVIAVWRHRPTGRSVLTLQATGFESTTSIFVAITAQHHIGAL